MSALNRSGVARIESVSCASPGYCSAGGYYDASVHGTTYGQPFVVNEVHGTWHKAIPVPGVRALNTRKNGFISSVSCTRPGDCSVGGRYLGHDLRASLAAIHAALRDGGRFAFETRHPQARAWEDWNPSNGTDITGPAGRPLRVWHEVESVDGDVVTFTGTTAEPDGVVLRVDRASLRFLDPQALRSFLESADFQIEAQYGDWHRAPITATSREIITVARKRADRGRAG